MLGGVTDAPMCMEITVTARTPTPREANMFEACHGRSYCDVMRVTCPPAAVPRVMIRTEKDVVSHRESRSVLLREGAVCPSPRPERVSGKHETQSEAH